MDRKYKLILMKKNMFPVVSVCSFIPLFVEALQKQSHVEYLLDVLLSPDMEELGRRAHEFFTLHSSLFTSLTAAAVYGYNLLASFA